MRDMSVPNKTAAGRDEIESRTRKLPAHLRSILLLVDGQRTARQLHDVISGLHAPVDALDQLVSLGLIADTAPAGATPPTFAEVPAPSPAAANRYSVLYALMSDAVREHLGMRGYFLQLKIERCGNADELLALLPDLSAAVARARDMGQAVEFEQRLRAFAQA
jgi:hypothetical protein